MHISMQKCLFLHVIACVDSNVLMSPAKTIYPCNSAVLNMMWKTSRIRKPYLKKQELATGVVSNYRKNTVKMDIKIMKHAILHTYSFVNGFFCWHGPCLYICTSLFLIFLLINIIQNTTLLFCQIFFFQFLYFTYSLSFTLSLSGFWLHPTFFSSFFSFSQHIHKVRDKS